MILKVLPRIGQRKLVADIYCDLMALYPNDPYAKQKAAGVLGGSSNSGLIQYDNGYWVRVR